MSKKITTEDFVLRSNKIHGNKYDYSKVNYINNYTKIIIICSVHGEFHQTPGNHLNYGCKKCGEERSRNSCRSNKNEFIEKARKIHGDKYDYSNVSYINSSNKITIICPIHGEFEQYTGGHLYGYGCKKCAVIGRKQNEPKTLEKFIEDSRKIHGDKYDYSNVSYVDSNTKVEIICSKHGKFWQKPAGHLNGKGCLECVGHISKPEIKFLDYLKIPNIKKNRQKYIKPFKIDGIKGNKIFEFLGDYYHGNPKTKNPNDYNTICHKTFKELYENTMGKFNRLNDMGYSIYYMWENDWNLWNKNKILTFPIKKYDGSKI